MRRPLAAALWLVLLTHGGCERDTDLPEGKAATEPAGPEQRGSFLNEPAGVPPSPLVPEKVQLRIRAAPDLVAAEAALAKLTSAGPVETVGSERRVTFGDGSKVQQDELLALVQSGARGNLVLWYPLLTIRERLNDGRAGVWRGITRLRDTLPSRDDAHLGGTPVFFGALVDRMDAVLLGEGTPRGYSEVVPDDRFVFLPPKSASVMSADFDQAVESLVPLVKQGGRAWILIALPLAEEYKPERF